MPLTLLEPTLRQELRRGDITIAYFEAGGDVVYEALTRVQRDPVTGEPKDRHSATEFLAPYVTNWAGVADRGGTPVPWPGAEAFPSTVPVEDLPAGGRHVTEDELKLRRRLLAKLMWNLIRDVDNLVAVTFIEGSASGKD